MVSVFSMCLFKIYEWYIFEFFYFSIKASYYISKKDSYLKTTLKSVSQSIFNQSFVKQNVFFLIVNLVYNFNKCCYACLKFTSFG